MSSLHRRLILGATGVLAASTLLYACSVRPGSRSLVTGDAASRVYVAPGDHDELYSFMSGGFSGNVTVYGLPSGRLLKTIPVFSQFPENGYGYSEETKPLLETSTGFVPWDDSHHPQLSKTNSMADGRWLFINANNTPRIARINLSTFETDEILEIPNTGGGHASPFVTANTEYVVSASRFSVPVPNSDVPIAEFQQRFRGTISFVRADRPGQMDVAFQINAPGFNYDLGRAGKGPSEGWFFFTSYNTEQAYTMLEVNASQNDKDFIAAINWKLAEQCVADGKARDKASDYRHNYMDEHSRIARSNVRRSVKMLEPRDCPGVIYFLPTPKSPHGVDVDPSGEYIVASGKLASLIPVHGFSRMQQAIADRAFDGEFEGIPILSYEATIVGEVQNPGLGPLHTEFDGRGNAYTSMFISSEVVKWRLGTWEVLDRIPVFYSVGHIMIPGGDTREPYGRYLVAMNKITKDRYLPTGGEMAQAGQLIDISGDKMRLLLDFPLMGEPHYAQALPASLLKDKQVQIFELSKNTHPMAVRNTNQGGIERRGRTVHVRMAAIRSHFAPDNIEGVQIGDTVLFHVTNIDQDWDILHGFAVAGATNANLILQPGETRTLKWVPTQVGVFPFYCTDFCSALHQEMQGYIRVSPAGSTVPLVASISDRTLTQSSRAAAVNGRRGD